MEAPLEIPEPHLISLTDDEWEHLQKNFAATTNEGTKLRAEEIARVFLHQLGLSRFEFARGSIRGADLTQILLPDNSPCHWDVKGIKKKVVPKAAVQGIVVSSRHSYQLLKSKEMGILRITGVFDRNPVAYILICDEHFRLKPQERWIACKSFEG